ncbi:MAG: glycosyltransferase family 4 protein [Gemmatimonadales bacterium]
MITATPRSVREGSGTYVASAVLPRALEDLGHEVRLVCPPRTGGPLGYTVQRFLFNWGLRPGMFHEADAVVGWDMDGFLLAGRLASPFVAYIHGQLAEEASFERGVVAATMKLQARAEQVSVRKADHVITVSERSRRRIAELYGVSLERIEAIPPPFDLARWQAALDSAGPRPDDRPTVLSVAHMYRRKNLASLIRAAAILRRRVPDVRVVIVGTGPEYERLVRLAESLELRSIVEFTGQIGFRALRDAYAHCDVFCLPSLQEGFGLVFLEAMAAGLPIVACRDTAAEELIEDGVSGILVGQHDDHALAHALADLLEEADPRRAMGAEAETRVGTYTAETTAKRFVAAVSRCARRQQVRS